MRQAHTEGDKQQCLGQHAGLRISFSGFLPGTEMGSECNNPAQVFQICYWIFLVLHKPWMRRVEERQYRPLQIENILQRPWVSIAQDPRAMNLQSAGKKWPIVTKSNVGLQAFLQHHPSPCRPLARQHYCAKPKSLEGPASAHHPGWVGRWFPGSCPRSLEARPQSLCMCSLPSKAAPPWG